jgi:hypothetical protein
MEDLTKVLLQLVTEWKKCALAGQKKRCNEIVVTIRMMGYVWPRGSNFGNLWRNFLSINFDTMEQQVTYAVTALQSEEEKWFASQWRSNSQCGERPIDYRFAIEEFHNLEKWAKETVDIFGQPIL